MYIAKGVKKAKEKFCYNRRKMYRIRVTHSAAASLSTVFFDIIF